MKLQKIKLNYNEDNIYGKKNTSFMKFLEGNIEIYLPNIKNKENIYIYSKPKNIINLKKYDCFISKGILAYRLLGNNTISDNALLNISLKNMNIFKYNIIINLIIYKLENKKELKLENLKINKKELIENVRDRVYCEEINSTFKLNEIANDFVDIIVENN